MSTEKKKDSTAETTKPKSLLDQLLEQGMEVRATVERSPARQEVEGIKRPVRDTNPLPLNPKINTITGPIMLGSSAWPIPFGKYRGQALGDINTDYLAWCLDNMEQLREDSRVNISTEISKRDPEALLSMEEFFRVKPHFKPARPTIWKCRVCKREGEDPRKKGCKLSPSYWNKVATV